MNPKNSWILLFAFLLLVIGCKQEIDLDAPPKIMYGEDACNECGMIINESLHAASYVTKAGDVRRFDDIGGMLLYDQKMTEDVHFYWVHDFNTEEWINAEEATFVLDADLITPMGWGVVAFGETAVAETFATEHDGATVDFAALQNKVKTGELDPTMHNHDTGSDSMDHDETEHEDHDAAND